MTKRKEDAWCVIEKAVKDFQQRSGIMIALNELFSWCFVPCVNVYRNEIDDSNFFVD